MERREERLPWPCCDIDRDSPPWKLSWSSGKDPAWALHTLRSEDIDVVEVAGYSPVVAGGVSTVNQGLKSYNAYRPIPLLAKGFRYSSFRTGFRPLESSCSLFLCSKNPKSPRAFSV